MVLVVVQQPKVRFLCHIRKFNIYLNAFVMFNDVKVDELVNDKFMKIKILLQSIINLKISIIFLRMSYIFPQFVCRNKEV